MPAHFLYKLSFLTSVQMHLQHFDFKTLSCRSLLPKKRKNYCKTSSFTKEQCALELGEEAALWKGTWPLALQLRPGSEQGATVVITERLIADRTFQQPVVNWMELRGRKLQMHRHDRCSADDLYFGVVRGQACHFALFILLSKVTKKKHLCLNLKRFWSLTFSGKRWGEIIAEVRATL